MIKKRNIICGLGIIATASVLITACGGAAAEHKTESETTTAAQEVEKTMPAPVTQKGLVEKTAQEMLPAHSYELSGVHEVDGRQGIAWKAESTMYPAVPLSHITIRNGNWSQRLKSPLRNLRPKSITSVI